ncbi:MAG: DHA2 family efflux MFS transporter permease subunit [Pseudomonadota bacterium]|nr:DHA2 family efflux MFS transporter permease subunit [Pseudomonadota bacterium]
MSEPNPHSLQALQARHGDRYRWRVLLTVMIGSIASVMSSTIVNVAVPDLIQYFHVGQERAQWVAAGFMAAMTLAMLPTPWLLARMGYRHAYVAAVSLLMAGGIVGGLARDFELVLAMRAAEGLAAGVLQTIPAIVILRAFGEGQRGKALGIFGFGVVLAPAVGPSVGGVLVEHFGWRSIFFFVVPFAIAAIVMARRYLPVSAPGGAEPGGRGGAPLDWVGLALASVGVVGLLNGLVHLHDAAGHTAALLIGVGLTAMALFLWQQSRATTPLMHLRLFRSRPFAMGSLVAFVYGMALFGSTYLVPVFMQTALHFPPSEAGAALLPAGLVLALTIPLAGRLADRFPPRWLVTGGLALLAVSFGLMATVGIGTTLWLLIAWAVVGRLGLGFVLPSLMLGAVPGLDANASSHAASTINFLRQLGGATGISLVGIFLEWRLRHHAAVGGSPVQGFADTFWLVALLSALATVAAVRMTLPRQRASSSA